MANAFSVLSLKRHRSTSLSQTSLTPSEPINKHSRFKFLRFSVTSKFSNTINSERTNSNPSNGFFSLQLFRVHQQVKDKDEQQDKHYTHFNTSIQHNTYHSLEQNSRQQNNEPDHDSAPIMIPITNKKKKLKSILVTKTRSSNSTTTASYTSDPTQFYSSHISASNMTVNSEDLTAKEFASLAGIRIITEFEDEEEDEDDHRTYKKEDDEEEEEEKDEKRGDQERRRFSEEDTNMFLHSLSSSSAIGSTRLSSTSKESNLKPKIWDHEFWIKPNDNSKSPPLAHPTITTSSSYQEQDLSPILNEFRRMGTYSSSPEKSNVIRKGRFEISLEN